MHTVTHTTSKEVHIHVMQPISYLRHNAVISRRTSGMHRQHPCSSIETLPIPAQVLCRHLQQEGLQRAQAMSRSTSRSNTSPTQAADRLRSQQPNNTCNSHTRHIQLNIPHTTYHIPLPETHCQQAADPLHGTTQYIQDCRTHR